MTTYIGGLIEDPDSLGYELATYTATTTKELVIDVNNSILKLTQVGNLTRDGTTLQCLYSRLKDIWNTDNNVVMYPFPINPVTDEKFELINGWNFDQAVNPTTKITIVDCSASNNALTIITGTGNFNANYIAAGYYISGANIAGNARVATVNSNTSITMTTATTGNIAGTLTFNSGSDYTYNLIRTGGWALKDASGVSQEEYMGAITLGGMGAEGLIKTLTLTANVSNSANLYVTTSNGVVSGSFVAIPGALTGTRVATVYTQNMFSITRPITANVGTRLTVRPADQVYYSLGNVANVAPINGILHGAINQPIKIYGDASHGDFDYRTPAIAKFYVRSQGYSYGEVTIQDIGISSLTYQAYRFSLTNTSDSLYITHTDTEISTTGLTATQSPYSNMNITWYATAQPRVIGGSTYYFNVIINADTTKSPSDPYEYGAASAEQIYEFVQWTLRRPAGIDIDSSGASVRTGTITRALLEFIGTTLYTIYDNSDGGVYIDHFKEEDINRLVFSDNTNRQFPYVSFGSLVFNNTIAQDGTNATYSLYYKQINQGNIITGGRTLGGSLTFGVHDAVLVRAFTSDPSNDGTNEIRGNLHGGLTSVSFDYDWDLNTQCQWILNTRYYVGDEYRYRASGITRWYRVTAGYISEATWSSIRDGANSTEILGPTVICVAVGRTNGQYYSNAEAPLTLAKSNTNVIEIIALPEKNYAT